MTQAARALLLAAASVVLLVPAVRADEVEKPIVPPPDAGITLPKLFWKSEPIFPKSARKKKLEAKLIYQLVVRKNGSTGDIQLLACNVHKASDPDAVGKHFDCSDFEKAATKALGEWRYEPALRDGSPIAVYYTVRVDFRQR